MLEAIITLITATALLLGSPGPAPMALAAVGAAYPLQQGLKFLAGILAGLIWVMLFAAFILNGLISIHPYLLSTMQVLAALYIVWVAYKIATAPINPSNADTLMEPGFWQGFVFNLINPKAYAAFVALFSSFMLPGEDSLHALLKTAACCFMVAAAVDGIWLIAGRLLRSAFSTPKQGRYLRIAFALLMVIAVAFAASKSAVS
ncbi:LysE family translocator [uncultured Pseudoteredinibacter sp.]|uniref:LysE family translocator n=1 Tax=uncultured Pseudoteredinibacter sp. TaxID=1641701 RepID=UPI002601B53A|nr:LysE family translocator [uncultured Pseudoteredinibacter sp.]